MQTEKEETETPQVPSAPPENNNQDIEKWVSAFSDCV